MDPSTSTWETLNHLFTVVVDIDEFGQSQRMSSLVRARFGVSAEDSFNFFDAFEFKRPARFSGGVSRRVSVSRAPFSWALLGGTVGYSWADY